MSNLVGQTLLIRYCIEAPIGRGGIAEVYKVWDNRRTTFLALKLPRGDLAEDAVFLRRFKREAQTLARLQHPNIVRFYGLEQDGVASRSSLSGVAHQCSTYRRHKPVLNCPEGRCTEQLHSSREYLQKSGLSHDITDRAPMSFAFVKISDTRIQVTAQRSETRALICSKSTKYYCENYEGYYTVERLADGWYITDKGVRNSQALEPCP